MYILNSDSSFVRAETVESMKHKINILLQIKYEARCIRYVSRFLEKATKFFNIF